MHLANCSCAAPLFISLMIVKIYHGFGTCGLERVGSHCMLWAPLVSTRAKRSRRIGLRFDSIHAIRTQLDWPIVAEAVRVYFLAAGWRAPGGRQSVVGVCIVSAGLRIVFWLSIRIKTASRVFVLLPKDTKRRSRSVEPIICFLKNKCWFQLDSLRLIWPAVRQRKTRVWWSAQIFRARLTTRTR